MGGWNSAPSQVSAEKFAHSFQRYIADNFIHLFLFYPTIKTKLFNYPRGPVWKIVHLHCKLSYISVFETLLYNKILRGMFNDFKVNLVFIFFLGGLNEVKNFLQIYFILFLNNKCRKKDSSTSFYQTCIIVLHLQ